MANNIRVTGNVTKEPELRFTKSGKATCTVGIADNRRYQVNGEWTEKVQFVNLVMWEGLAENAAATLTKGMRVTAEGRMEIRDYEKQDGSKGYSIDVIVDEVGPSLRWATASVERNAKDGMSSPAKSSVTSGDFGDSAEEPF